MIQKFVEAWDGNKSKLEEHLKTHRMEEYDEYEKLVKLLFEIVINPYISTQGHQPTTLKTSRLGSESSNARRTWSGD